MKIIYIVGRGHNGSTVLDLILGNHPAIQSTGELSSGFTRGPEESCSCGDKLSDCKFWAPIRNKLDEQFPEVKSDGYAKMLRYLDNFYRMPQILSRFFLPAWVTQKYLPMTESLFDSIAATNHTDFVVDSSKEFSRAAFLLSHFPERAKVIYLVRDGRAIMWSYLKRLRKHGTFNFMRRKWKVRYSWPAMCILVASFIIGEMFALILKMFYGNRILTVRYEDICSMPKTELTRIGEFVGVDLRELGESVENREFLKIGHNIGGNPTRFSATGDFVFKPDFSWKDGLPRSYQLLYRWLGTFHAWRNDYLSTNSLEKEGVGRSLDRPAVERSAPEQVEGIQETQRLGTPHSARSRKMQNSLELLRQE